jgi:DeoR family fructose operon transcriptional repressor
MIAAERINYIIGRLQDERVVNTFGLSENLNVSAMTIRRDLAQLEEMGLCKRTHGGAVAAGRSVLTEIPYNERELHNVKEKHAIAHLAIELIESGDLIALDSGSTTLEFAKILKKKNDITVITNSVYATLELFNYRNISVVSTAGTLSYTPYSGNGVGDPCLVGPLAEETIRRFRPPKAIMGTSGLNIKDGISNSNIDQATMKKVMMEVSAEVIMLADSSKFGHTASSIVGPVTLIHTLVTDTRISKKMEIALIEKGIRVLKADPD